MGSGPRFDNSVAGLDIKANLAKKNSVAWTVFTG
jgi:hypothetical protein